MAPDAAIVVPVGRGSLDYYAAKLAERLGVATIHVAVEETSLDYWNVPLAGRVSLRAALGDAALIARLRRVRRRLLHLPSHHVARYAPFLRTPCVVTVHDLIRVRDVARPVPLIHRPNRRDRLVLRLDVAGIRRAAAVIAVSETTKDEIVSHLGLPPARVAVVYEGVDHEVFRPVAPADLGFPYVIYVGSEQPRKDLATLIRAFARLKRDARFRGLKLVKVGGASGSEASLREATRAATAAAGVADDVEFVGRVPEADLPRLYAGAECFVLTSLHEGFGLPPIEAMACGCPVVVTNAGALPEVAGPGAVVVPVGDDAAVARAVAEIITDSATRTELRRRGLAHASAFSWERAARETMRVYERAF